MSLVKIGPILETKLESYCSFVKVAFLFWNFFGKFHFFEVAKFKFEFSAKKYMYIAYEFNKFGQNSSIRNEVGILQSIFESLKSVLTPKKNALK